MYKNIALVLMCLLAFSSKNYAACTVQTNPVNFTANLTNAHSDNAYLQLVAQTIAASSALPINGCTSNYSGPSNYNMRGTGLNTSDQLNIDKYVYYRIPANAISPPSLPSTNFQVYIAYSIKDNQNSAQEHWINDPNFTYELYNSPGNQSSTRGLRLQNVRILVTGLGNSPEGTYKISNLKLGELSVKDRNYSFPPLFYDDTTTTVSITLNGSFQIKKSTCVINNRAAINVMLPTVPSSTFTKIGQTAGDTTFNVSVTGCSTGDANKTLVALLTDNNDTSASNTNGLLKNIYSDNVSVQITDSTGSSLPIAPKNINNSSSFFSFGTIASDGTVSKTFKARYYSKVANVSATLVQAQATITLIYN